MTYHWNGQWLGKLPNTGQPIHKNELNESAELMLCAKPFHFGVVLAYQYLGHCYPLLGEFCLLCLYERVDLEYTLPPKLVLTNRYFTMYCPLKRVFFAPLAFVFETKMDCINYIAHLEGFDPDPKKMSSFGQFFYIQMGIFRKVRFDLK